MKHSAIGIRAHSGWAAAVVLSGTPGNLVVIERSRIVVTDPTIAGGNQPYHFAASRNFSESDAEKYLASYTSATEQLAMAAMGTIFQDLKHRGHIVDRCAILQASGRTLPPISKILVAHPLVHTAEGELFRQAFWTAAERLNLKVIGIRETDLDARAESTFGSVAVQVKREIAALGKSLGPPWTTDQNAASLAALLVLTD